MNKTKPLEEILPDLAPSKMNKRQQRFVQEYLKDFNGRQACIRAGYSERTSSVQAARLLTNANLIDHIRKGTEAIAKDNDITVSKIIRDLEEVRVAALKAGQYGPANRSIELLGKYIGMFNDKLEVQHQGTIELNDIDRAARITALMAKASQRKDTVIDVQLPHKKDE